MYPNDAGVHRGSYVMPTSGHEVEVVDVVGARPGPRLCVMAGMHPNEVSSVEAARRLEYAFEPAEMRGVVSIITVLNTDAWASRAIGITPTDGKNINFCFPGNPEGSFSERLAFDLLEHWSRDSVCLADLHGGDLGEDLMPYTICQLTGDPDFDRRAMAVAQSFESDVVVALDPSYLEGGGRSVTGLARSGRLGGFAEAGMGGVIGESHVEMHFSGVLALAELFEICPAGRVARSTKDRQVLDGYTWLPCPITGWADMMVHAGETVQAGQLVARIADMAGSKKVEVLAPNSGVVLWCDTHPAVTGGSNIAGIGFRRASGH